MQWHEMGWPAYGSPGQKENTDQELENVPGVDDVEIEIDAESGPAPIMEIRDLLRRLFGEPDECGTPSPYLAAYNRYRGTARTQVKTGQRADLGIADFGYWQSLKLGYLESVRVQTDIRKKGIGIRLVNFVLKYLKDHDVRKCYSFAVNPEGYNLLKNSGFSTTPPEDPARPWRAWFEKNIV